jgi:hypothetical protein
MEIRERVNIVSPELVMAPLLALLEDTPAALTSGNKCIRIDEPAHLRIIIAGLEVVEQGFGVVYITALFYKVYNNFWLKK